MAGVRGFGDPNVHIAENGSPIWYQPTTLKETNLTTALLPFYINAAGGNISLATQCMTAGSNSFAKNHAAFAQGDNNQWVVANTPFSWGHYLRQDIPTHFALADGWTVGDMYAEGVVASTHPNRAFWASGSVNVPGGPQTPDQGGVVLDNNVTPGCEGTNLDCFPYFWPTYAEFLEKAGVSWQVDINLTSARTIMHRFAWFNTFREAPANSSLAQRGTSFLGLQKFYDDAAAGKLANVTYIIGPKEVSEHPPWTPHDGGWFQQQIVNAVINSPGGWGDHVLPIFSPTNTPGEWVVNPSNSSQTVFAGPGFRLPFTAISPWSRGGHVFTAHSDHSSQIKFMEQWLTAKGVKNIVTDQLNGWRRDHMSDLTQMFDFAHPDLSLPNLPIPPPPLLDSNGNFIGSPTCQAEFPNPQPPIPYGQQTRETSLQIENGFKPVRGALTEGRFLVFETKGLALTYSSLLGLTLGKAVPKHDNDDQRFILHATAPPPATTFNLQFAGSPKRGYVDNNNRETSSISKAAVFNITDLGNGKGYTIDQTSGGAGQFLDLLLTELSEIFTHEPPTFSVYSVTKSTDSGTGFSPGP
ncbi:hypothetical protein Clacol_005219 [Clathrus columnatus]|uniref:Uncharacterized protein n=1 Tax=Clathrus columnatus TaxID=1419009 RepID=A0AAV5AGC6_9AGAM|nr:hypothetical protein Clacol_005219 [Clathrus columnatus]